MLWQKHLCVFSTRSKSCVAHMSLTGYDFTLKSIYKTHEKNRRDATGCMAKHTAKERTVLRSFLTPRLKQACASTTMWAHSCKSTFSCSQQRLARIYLRPQGRLRDGVPSVPIPCKNLIMGDGALHPTVANLR